MRPKIPDNLQQEDPELTRRRELEQARAEEQRLSALQELATDQTKQRIRLFGGFTAGSGSSSSVPVGQLRIPQDFSKFSFLSGGR